MLLSRLALVAALAVTYASLDAGAYAQSTGNTLSSLPGHSRSSFSGAANRWQLTAGDETAQNDAVAPTLRTIRNSYWSDQLSQFRQQSDVPSGVAVGGGSYLSDAPEIDPSLGKIFAIVQFESFKVFDASRGLYLPYTEMYFRVKRVIKQPLHASIKVNDLIAEDIPGGRLKAPDGTFKTLRLQPESHYFQPQHTYLVQLTPSIGGTFAASKRWEVSSGVVTADTDQEISRSNAGRATLPGRSVDDAATIIQQSAGGQHEQ